MNSTIKVIEKLYDKLTYFDLYGGSLLLVIFYSIIILLLIGYTYALYNSARIKANWDTERCNPVNMPFVGFINKPPNYTISEFTEENLKFCSKNAAKEVTDTAFEPIYFIISSITKLYTSLLESIQLIRTMVDSIRTNLLTITDTIFQKMVNIIIPLNKITLAISNMMGKTTGILVTALYAVIGAFDILKSLFGAILQILEGLLIPIVAFIIVCYVLGAFYLAIAPSIVAATLGTVIGILIAVQSLMGQGIAVNSCFDKNTPILLASGPSRNIKDIKIGDKLSNNDIVTATMKLSAENIDMYKLNGIIISGTHYVKYNNKFIQVVNHPKREKVFNYCEPFIYCISTTSKTITIENNTYLDWDDDIRHKNIASYLHQGYNENTLVSVITPSFILQPIKDIQINDILLNGQKVIGIVELLKEDKYLDKTEHVYNLITDKKKLSINNSEYGDYDFALDLCLGR